MTKVTAAITMSLDGFITGPNDGPVRGLGDGGERLYSQRSRAPLPHHAVVATG